ncbi:MAG: hypothetical protein GY859_14300, partial [Desulfobacterales bacterium]|nr:hypothetical protein [Desulfobacterales bacterium]
MNLEWFPAPYKFKRLPLTYIEEMEKKMRILRNLFILSLSIFMVFGASGAFAQSGNPLDQLSGEEGSGGSGGGQQMGPGDGQGQGPGGGQGFGQKGPAGPSGHAADGQYLYVVAQGSISQYSLVDLSLQATVDLPEPELEEIDPTEPPAEPTDPAEGEGDLNDLQSNPPEASENPARRGGPSGVFVEGDYLYILHGGAIFQYTLPDLVLLNTA